MDPDLAEYARGLRRRADERWRDAERVRTEAQERLRPIARELALQFGARRVVLFGSVAAGRSGVGSDVDFAVEGLPPERYWEALRFLESRLGADGVDLVEIEGAGHALRAKIESGIVLHG